MKKLKIVLLAAGVLLLLTTLVTLFFMNFNFGSVIFLGASCVLILYGLFFEKLIKIKILTVGIAAVCAFFLVMTLFITLYGNADNATYREDAVIVLGAGVNGEEISPMLEYRLETALTYCAKNPDAVIVVTGGQGPQEDITEATAMTRYLTANGIPESKILKEERATSTYENFLYTKDILEAYFQSDTYDVTFITNGFHIYRASWFAQKLGFDATHVSAGINWLSIPGNYLRECLALIKMWTLGV